MLVKIFDGVFLKKKQGIKKEKQGGEISLFQKFLFLLLMVSLFGGFYFFLGIHQEKGRYLKGLEKEKKDSVKEINEKQDEKKTKEGTAKESIIPPPDRDSSKEGKLVIVIDDLGQDEKIARDLINTGSKFTISILPWLPHSSKIAKLANEKNLPVILHLPMEPKEYPALNPGKGALLTSMNREEIALTLFKDIESIPHITGINNHMGSKFTEDNEKMKIVFNILKKKNFFFLDSLTTSSSVAKKISEEFGVPYIARDYFLDNDRNLQKIIDNIGTAAAAARKKGVAVAIAHPYPETIAALKLTLPHLKEKGISIVPITELIKR